MESKSVVLSIRLGLRQDVFDDMTMNIGQAELASLVAERKSLVINTA